MNDQQRAVSILKKARDYLIQRLSERVIENEQEILDDAAGQTYLSEIGTIYEEFGLRLVHLNQILGGLPPIPDQRMPENIGTVEYVDGLHDYDSLSDEGNSDGAAAERSETTGHETLTLPSPTKSGSSESGGERVPMQAFVAQIEKGDLDEATRLLAETFRLEGKRARRCVEQFHALARQSAETLQKPRELYHELRIGHYHDVLTLLQDYFGLQGLETIGVMQTLRNRWGAKAV